MSVVKRRLVESAERVNPIVPVHIWLSPAGAAVDVIIVAHHSVYSAIHEHTSSALPNETGGFLLGRVACDQRDSRWHLEIDEVMPVEPISQNPTHFAFTWRDVDRVRSYREEHGKALLGWYHTHPNLGIFLSDTDLERTHRVLFAEPFQIALVYDPVRGRAGYFFWEAPQVIDASEIAWREFEIAVAGEPNEPDTSEEPPAPAIDVNEVHRLRTSGADPDSTPPPTLAAKGPSPSLPQAAATDLPLSASAAPAIDLPLSVTASPANVPSSTTARRSSGLSTSVWMILSVALLLVGLLIGYLWFAPARG